MNAVSNQSPLAALEANANKASTSSNKTGGEHVTGQYMYDRFVKTQSQESITKMHIIRHATTTVDVATWDKVLKEMVKLAAEHGAASKKSAQNVASWGRAIYGGIRFARDEMIKLGYDENCGLIRAANIASEALRALKKKWDGQPMTTHEQKADRAQARQVTRLTKLVAEIQANTKMDEGEDINGFMARTFTMAQQALSEQTAKEMQEKLDKQAKTLIQSLGLDMAKILAEQIAYLVANPDELKEEAASVGAREEGYDEPVNQGDHATA